MSAGEAGLYVHVPFCDTKCPYCDFVSVTTGVRDELLASIVAEARAQAPGFGRFATTYLGGGTPSALSPAQITRLVQDLRDACPISPDAEVTLEANPDDVTPDVLKVWREIGVDRLSLGIQSLDEGELQLLGRRHDSRQGLAAIEAARDAGFDNLGVDLIWGLPGQTIDGWLTTLERVVERRPEHLSCYQLTLEDHTPLGRQVAAGQHVLPDEETSRRFFLETSRVLVNAGYEHYEISSFARGPARRSRHNQLYWDGTPYLGLGPSAHSFDGRRRWWNVSSVDEYPDRLASEDHAIGEIEELDDVQLTLERLMLGLRTADGISVDHVRCFHGGDQAVADLSAAGLVRVDDGWVRPTVAGFAVADAMVLRFGEVRPTRP